MTADTKCVAEHKPFITSITLGGFQVFDKPTTIPLGHLTLLFGPNSAGKSAIQDGLVMLRELLATTPSAYGDAPHAILSLAGAWSVETPSLARHWRRTDDTPNGFAPTLTVGLTGMISTNLASSISEDVAAPISDVPDDETWTTDNEIGVTFCFFIDDDYEVGEDISRSYRFTLAVNGRDVLCLDSDENLGVNFTHPLLRQFKLTHNFPALSNEHPQYLSSEGGWVFVWSKYVHYSRRNLNREALFAGLGKTWDDLKDRLRGLDENKSKHLYSAINELLDFFESVASIALGNMSFETHLVPASRQIPSAGALRHLCPGSVWDPLVDDDDSEKNSDPTYRELAHSYLEARLARMTATQSRGSGLIGRVNHMLSDHLFLERGYSIAANVRLHVDLDDFSSLANPNIEEARKYPAIVQMYLLDSSGRRHLFEDVGSGLGYVLPVLCSICDAIVSTRGEKNCISFVQQPELHLHPALQAALGDVAIEAGTSGRQIILETHSEHLLLRILKRVRQASTDNTPTPELRINPKNVIVVYFDPKQDGTTSVKHLRISEDGEFLDRWPRGFFTERDGELFDE